MLGIMVTCASMIAPLTLLLNCKIVPIKIVWRSQGSLFLSFATAMLQWIITKNGKSPVRIVWENRYVFMKVGITQFIWIFSYIYGASMTVTSHAAILYTSSCVYLIVFSLLLCQDVPTFCKIALVFYVTGVYLMISDPYAVKVGSDSPSLFGDLICFLGAAVGALG